MDFGCLRRTRYIDATMEIFHRPLAELRAEYWMIQKLGCGGFGKVRSV